MQHEQFEPHAVERSCNPSCVIRGVRFFGAFIQSPSSYLIFWTGIVGA